MIINFDKIRDIMPKNGRLTLIFELTDENTMVVAYKPTYDGAKSTDENALAPYTVRKTIKELEETWEKEITDISIREKMLTGDSYKQKMKALEKAEKVKTAATPAKDDSKKTATKKTSSLFDKKDAEKAAPTPAGTSEREEDDSEPFTDEEETGGKVTSNEKTEELALSF